MWYFLECAITDCFSFSLWYVNLHFVIFHLSVVFCGEVQINEFCKRTLPHCHLYYWSLSDVGLGNNLVLLVKTAFYIDPVTQAASQTVWIQNQYGILTVIGIQSQNVCWSTGKNKPDKSLSSAQEYTNDIWWITVTANLTCSYKKKILHL